MGYLFGEIRGGLAISTVLVGSLLAASTGVVGASVVAMGVISLPVMLKYNYSKHISTGTICAAGTLGQIIPPSIVLIILGDVFNVPVGDLFKAALMPGLVLVAAYVVYILVAAYLNPQIAPAVKLKRQEGESKKQQVISALFAIIPPLSLIVIVLGSIFAGIATPTESSAIGCAGAVILAFLYRKFSFAMLMESSKETVKITAMVFAILIGATAFSMVFTYTGADALIEHFMLSLPGDKWGFIIIVNASHNGSRILYRFCRNFLYYRTNTSSYFRSYWHQSYLVCYLNCNESADFLFNSTLWLQLILFKRSGSEGYKNNGYL